MNIREFEIIDEKTGYPTAVCKLMDTLLAKANNNEEVKTFEINSKFYYSFMKCLRPLIEYGTFDYEFIMDIDFVQTD